MESLTAVYIFCIGACLGSFMNVLTYRLPRGLSIVRPSSSCTNCGAKIRFYDNIPILSWLILGAKCRDCGSKISFMYPMTELVTGLLFLAVYLRFGVTPFGFAGFALVFFMLSAAFADLFTALDTEHFECGIIPDSIVAAGLIVCGGLSMWAHHSWTFSVYGAAVGFLGLFIPSWLFKVIRKKEGMGGGDIKLMAVCGAALGVQSIFFIIFCSALIGAVFGIALQIFSKEKNIMLPFGPFIAGASVIYLFYSDVVNRFLYGI